MHHGTLLYSADLSEMSGALNVNREKLVTKGIESVKSRVANISALSEKLSGVSPEEFLLDILRFAESEYGAPSRKLTGEERGGISSRAIQNTRHGNGITARLPRSGTKEPSVFLSARSQ